jgi:tetratricopeptide (TPR) repeat protein
MKLTAVDYYERARARSSEGDNKGALADINRAIRSDPRMAMAYFARGNIKRCTGDAKGAIADFNKAIKLDAKNTSAYIGRGMARTQKGVGRAINDFKKAIKLDPKSSEAYFGRGWAHAGKGDTKEAISDFTRAIKLNPQYGMAYMLRGEAYRANCETDKAIADAVRYFCPDLSEHTLGHQNGDCSFGRALFPGRLLLAPLPAQLQHEHCRLGGDHRPGRAGCGNGGRNAPLPRSGL